MTELSVEQAAQAAVDMARAARGHSRDAMDAAGRADECADWRDRAGARRQLALAKAAAARTLEAAKRCHAVCPDGDDMRLVSASLMATDAVHSADAAVVGAEHAVGT